eukprot:4846370-Karenia_brevis.AAC.1
MMSIFGHTINLNSPVKGRYNTAVAQLYQSFSEAAMVQRKMRRYHFTGSFHCSFAEQCRSGQ